jgi:hypothetical protein
MAAPDGACWAVSQREPSHIQKVRVSWSKRTSPLEMSGPSRCSNVTSLCFQFIIRRKPPGPGSQVVACLTFSGRKCRVSGYQRIPEAEKMQRLMEVLERIVSVAPTYPPGADRRLPHVRLAHAANSRLVRQIDRGEGPSS